MATAQWIWLYGLERNMGLSWTRPDPVSRWLDSQRPLLPSQRETQLQALVSSSYSDTRGNPVPALLQHAWWCAYNPATRGFGPWTKVRAQ